MSSGDKVFLSYAFRPFFLLNGMFAIAIVLLWVLVLSGHGPATLPANTVLWHAHEMLIGFAMAVIAGFVLTAVATWTGRPPVNGVPLVLLVSAWLAGRLVMLLAGVTPGWLVASVDMTFPLLLCFFVAREIVGAGSRRNYPIVAITLLLAGLNLVFHLGALGLLAGADRVAILLLVHTILLLIAVIGGRVIPNFTANWLRRREVTRLPSDQPLVDRATLLMTAIFGITASVAPMSMATGLLGFVAAVLHTLRLSRWRGLATADEPLLLALHVAYAWLPIGYVLSGFAVFGWLVSPTGALHALTMGAMGGMILAMTTRVPLGHTGRALTASRLTVVAYLALTVAVITRVFGPLLVTDYMATIEWSAVAWMTAFAVFVFAYWPVFTQPRVSST